MPSKSQAQFKFFKAMEENPELAKKRGISKKVSNEFTKDMTKDRWKNLKQKISKK